MGLLFSAECAIENLCSFAQGKFRLGFSATNSMERFGGRTININETNIYDRRRKTIKHCSAKMYISG